MATDLVAPIIPNAQDNKGAELFLQGAHTGLMAAAQIAEQRRQSELAMAKLAEDERTSQEAHALQLKQMEMQAPLYEAHRKMYDAQADWYTKRITDHTNSVIQFNQQQQALAKEIGDDATRLHLDNMYYATKNPIQYAANVMQFHDAWGQSPLRWVQDSIKKYQRAADLSTVPLRPSVEDGVAKGEAKAVPYWKIVQQLQDPDTKDSTIALLKANGLMNDAAKDVPGGAPLTGWQKFVNSAVDVLGSSGAGTLGVDRYRPYSPSTTHKEMVTEPTPQLKRFMDSGKDVKFEHVPSRIAPATAPRTTGELPAPDLPPDTTGDPQASSDLFTPTDTDMILGHAKGALAAGADFNAVAARLQQLGIDPGSLSA